MAGSKTDALEARVLDHLFKGGASPPLSALSTVYVALYTAGPDDGTAGTEVTGSSYARAATPAASWTRTGSSLSNNVEIAFPVVTTANYVVVGWAIMDAASSGNQLYWGDTTMTYMYVGEVPRFAPTALTVSED